MRCITLIGRRCSGLAYVGRYAGVSWPAALGHFFRMRRVPPGGFWVNLQPVVRALGKADPAARIRKGAVWAPETAQVSPGPRAALMGYDFTWPRTGPVFEITQPGGAFLERPAWPGAETLLPNRPPKCGRSWMKFPVACGDSGFPEGRMAVQRGGEDLTYRPSVDVGRWEHIFIPEFRWRSAFLKQGIPCPFLSRELRVCGRTFLYR